MANYKANSGDVSLVKMREKDKFSENLLTENKSPHTYETLDEFAVSANIGDIPDSRKDIETDDDSITNKEKGSVGKNICRGVIVAIVTVAFMAGAVVLLFYMLSNAEDRQNECPGFVYLKNGEVVNSTGNKQGAIITVRCDDGSKLVGSNRIVCLSSGNWSSVPTCAQKSCGDLILPDNMQIGTKLIKTSLGSEIFITCKDGYVLRGNNFVTCEDEDSWSDMPACLVIDCGQPDNVANAKQFDNLNTSFNSSFTVECLNGYRLKGSKTVTCTKSGLWDESPTCEKVSCGIPGVPKHGSISEITGTTFQATAVIKCVYGFKQIGSSEIRCQSNGKWTEGASCVNTRSDCLDLVKDHGIRDDGVYMIKTWKSYQNIQVYCDMSTDGGGWTVFQYRYDGSVDFNRNFSEYEKGFGNQAHNFWLGLRSLQEISCQGDSDLRIHVERFNGRNAYATFSGFSVSEGPDYTLHVGQHISFTQFPDIQEFIQLHNGSKFSTYDHDVDNDERNCAEKFREGWWYNNCSLDSRNSSIFYDLELKHSRIMIRRKPQKKTVL